MIELHLPWIELAVFASLLGAVFAARGRDPDVSRQWALVFSGVALALILAGWHDFITPATEGSYRLKSLAEVVLGRELLAIDEVNAPLLPLTALIFLLTAAATPHVKLRLFSFASALVSEATVLATFASREPWLIIGLLGVGVVPVLLELRARRKPTRVFALHMGLFIGLLTAGWAILEAGGHNGDYAGFGLVLLIVAVFIRSGIVPVHCWITDLFEHSSFGTALQFVAPMPGAYAALRLVLPIAPDWVMRTIGIAALVTALYAAGMVLVQREARRFFCYLFLSHSALVLVGMDTIMDTMDASIRPVGLTGGLCVWLSLALSLSGLGLTLRALEARHGRLSLITFHGLGENTPTLAVCFLLTGLASVGFPGTFGFLGSELLVDGAVQAYYAYIGIAVVVAAALNGIAMMRTYFMLFTGTRHVSSVPLATRGRERFAVLTFALLILGGGMLPQPMVDTCLRAATSIIEERRGNQLPAVVVVEETEPGEIDLATE